MNLKLVHLKGVLGTRLCHLLSTEAVFQTRTVGAVSRVAVRMFTSSSLVLRRDPWDSSAPGSSRCIASIAFGGKCSLSQLSPGFLSGFVRTSTTQASPAADVSEGEKPKANVNKTQISFDELKSLIVDGKVTLVDVREPEDLQNTGCLPNCINIPLTKLKTALALNDEDFKQLYNKAKLGKDDPNVVFYGLSSVKSSAAVEIAHKMGFKKSRHYPGGMEEWNQKHQKT